MQVVIGGAHNGKRKFVKEVLLNNVSGNQYFFEGEMPLEGIFLKEDFLIIGRFEELMLQKVHLEEEVISEWIFEQLLHLSQQARLICVCTDIGRGVVPLLKEERKIRDACGRLYQKLFTESESVIRIWYGIPEVIKSEGL